MSLSTDLMTIRKLAPHLRNFQELSPDNIKCSCNVCGDSKDRPWLARLNFIHFPDSDTYLCRCFNCGYVAPLAKYLKDFFPEEYNDSLFSAFLQKEEKKPEPQKIESSFTINLDQYKINSILKKYTKPLRSIGQVPGRPLSDRHLDELLYTENFEVLANEIQNKKKVKSPYPKIVIPLRNREGILIGIQARSVRDDDPHRYMIIHIQDGDLTFGLDKISLAKTILVTEGAIDSLYLDNAYATLSNGRLDNPFNEKHKSKIIIVLDNDINNKQSDRINKRLIEKGYKVFISRNIIKGKDVEDWHKNFRGDNLTKFIIENSKEGLEALLEYAR